jgi:hypothetical protein
VFDVVWLPPLSLLWVFQEVEERSKFDSSSYFLIDPDCKITTITNKACCPSPNIQNRVTFTERDVAVKRLRLAGVAGG